ncbi:chondroitin AC/alginate lyase [Truncatella angustata]|uniref:Chondroitin AC/alginate lyase n=1 Tax=Truncatella angustata TaxID=152316 RepID=A0A9P8RMV8_9PEZI|nr:chondroitin AC/alginate lyase [Truncatella angustata]KAH6646150.1 chondroitin AC/alginate lyase [Truncatella angustata]
MALISIIVSFCALASFSRLVHSTGTLSGLPILNGPIPVMPKVLGSKSRIGEFIHPGLWHTHDDLERIRLGVQNGVDPWKSAYTNFSTNQYSQSSYVIQGPKSIICRGSCNNYTSLTNDARAAYQNSLMWYITKNQSHWDRATTILDAWGTNLTSVIGADTSLLIGLEGALLANAAEIMRWEGGWIEAGAKAIGSSGFSNQLYWLLARQSIIIGQANYGMVSIKALLGYAVYLDDVTMWNYAIYAYQNDPCAGIYGNFDPSTGQGAETGRDQGHAQGAVGWSAESARIIQSQGTDVFSLGDNILLKAGEYTAKYNLGLDVPYDPKFYRCEAILVNGPWSGPSPISRGVLSNTPRIYDILYYEYAVKKGLNAPYITKIKEALQTTNGGEVPNGADHPGWGDLIWAYPGKGSFTNNDNRTLWGGGTIGQNGTGNLNLP